MAGPDLETWEGFCQYVAEEEDDFRLAIRGASALELLAERLVAESVPGELRDELKQRRQGAPPRTLGRAGRHPAGAERSVS